jgi:hydrogenase maturation factor
MKNAIFHKFIASQSCMVDKIMRKYRVTETDQQTLFSAIDSARAFAGKRPVIMPISGTHSHRISKSTFEIVEE